MRFASSTPGVSAASWSSWSCRAFADRASADACGIELLHELDEHPLDVLDRDEHVGRQRGADRLEIVGEVAVVVDRVDDGLTDCRGARVEILELELPQKMIAQRLLGAIGVFDGRARVAALRCFRRPRLLRVRPIGFRGDGHFGLDVRGGAASEKSSGSSESAEAESAAGVSSVEVSGSSTSSMRFSSSAVWICVCNSMTGSCNKRIACWSCGVMVSCCDSFSCRDGFNMQTL